MHKLIQVIFAVTVLAFASATSAQQTEKRIALVIGNAAYQAEALPTAANDAGLIAQTLQAAGFDVVGARDLDQDTLRRTLHDFFDKASASGPDTVAFVYLSGYGVQLEGENYFVPIDAKIARDTDISIEAIRVSDYVRPLAALRLKANIIVLDAARAHPFARSGQSLASGLSLVEPEKGMLVAFNAAPGTVAPRENGPYGAYAQALAEMIRTGGLPLGAVFDQVRLRVNEVTKGGEVPWNASKIDLPFVFFDRAPEAPPPVFSNDQVSSIRSKPIRDLGIQDAYVAALERDTLEGYLDFLAAYPGDPMAPRVRAIVAARREAITWRHTRVIDTPQAYWSYLRRYPRGPHVADAHRRLAYLAAAFEPPPSFAAITYDVPPPLEEEVVYFRRPLLVFDDPDYGFIPPPPPPIFFLPPPPPEFVVLAPPPPAFGLFVLPVPDFVPVPAYYNPPVYVAPPPPNIIYNNIHNTVVVNNTSNTVTITNPSGQTQTVTPAQAIAPQTASSAAQPAPAAAPAAPLSSQTIPSRTPTVSPGAAAVVGAAAGAALLAPSLPPSVAQKAIKVQNQTPPAAGTQPASPAQPQTQQQPQSPQPSQPGQPPRPGQPPAPGQSAPAGQPLPGQRGQPLPPVPGATPAPTQSGQPPPRQPAQPLRPGQPATPQTGQSAPGPGTAPATPQPGQPSTSPAQPQTKQPGQPPPSTTAPAQPPGTTRPGQQPPPAAATQPVAPPPAPPSAARPVSPPSPPPAAARPASPPPPPPAAARPAPPSAAAKPPACAPGLRLVDGKCVK
jgi:uncharacterized caspase-like protein